MAITVINNIDKVREQLKKNIYNALDAAGNFVKGEAIRKAPVDNGALRDHFGIEISVKDLKVRVYNDLEYAKFVEFGTGIFALDGNGRKTPWVYYYDGHKGEPGFRVTVGQKPQPFLMPAVEKNTDKITNIMAIQLKKGFENDF